MAEIREMLMKWMQAIIIPWKNPKSFSLLSQTWKICSTSMMITRGGSHWILRCGSNIIFLLITQLICTWRLILPTIITFFFIIIIRCGCYGGLHHEETCVSSGCYRAAAALNGRITCSLQKLLWFPINWLKALNQRWVQSSARKTQKYHRLFYSSDWRIEKNHPSALIPHFLGANKDVKFVSEQQFLLGGIQLTSNSFNESPNTQTKRDQYKPCGRWESCKLGKVEGEINHVYLPHL